MGKGVPPRNNRQHYSSISPSSSMSYSESASASFSSSPSFSPSPSPSDVEYGDFVCIRENGVVYPSAEFKESQQSMYIKDKNGHIYQYDSSANISGTYVSVYPFNGGPVLLIGGITEETKALGYSAATESEYLYYIKSLPGKEIPKKLTRQEKAKIHEYVETLIPLWYEEDLVPPITSYNYKFPK